MKKILLLITVTMLLMLSSQSMKAQILQNIACTGYTWDVVADGLATSLASTTRGVDSGGMVYIAPTFNPGSGACATTGVWPASLQVSSLITSGLTYNLQAPNVNNALLLTNGGSGSLTPTAHISASKLYVLANSGDGQDTTIMVVNFTDSTLQEFSGVIVPDWCNHSGANLTTGEFYRTGRNTSTSCSVSLCQYMFEIALPLDVTNQSKTIASVTFTNLSKGRLCIYAIGGITPANFQTITFPQIPQKLTTSPPFALNATASSGLPVGYTIVSGPATLSNDSVVTLTGVGGTVTIEAYQNGNVPQYDTAAPVINTFDVVDPNLVVPTLEARHPLAGNVYMPTLSKIQLAAISNIDYAPLFAVQSLSFIINGTTIPGHNFQNGHFTAWWQPPTYGTYTIQIKSTSNYGVDTSIYVNINVVATSVDTNVTTFNAVWLNTSITSSEASFDLPSYIGAYDSVYATLTLTCPTGGCGAWDRIASIEAKSHEGNWFEIVRYITPYATSCTHVISLNDYMSLLCGRVTLRLNCTTYDNGYLYTLSFQFKSGLPLYKYSQVTQIWKNNYDFGHYAALQPVSVYNFVYPAGVVVSKLKLVSTGHMGPNNTSNAAEFYEATHHVYVNNVDSFAQHNWTVCNPNPDHCSPQSGTWQYNRAGWCPGSVAQPFDYDMTQYIAQNNLSLKYLFYPGYTDFCSAFYPPCVTNSSCTCSDGLNPFLDVNCNLINFFNDAPPNPVMTNVVELKKSLGIAVYPNPSTGIFNLTANNKPDQMCTVTIYNLMGTAIKQFQWNGENTTFNLSNDASGVYILKVYSKDNVEVKKLMVR